MALSDRKTVDAVEDAGPGADPTVAAGREQPDRERRDVGSRLAALEASLDGVAVFDEDLKLTYANPAFSKLYGCRNGGVLARVLEAEGGWMHLYDKEQLNRIRDEVLPLVARSGSWRGRLDGRRFDGAAFVADTSLARLSVGGLVMVVRDVTDETRAQEELEKRQQMYSLLAQNSTDVISLHETDGRFIYASPSTLRLMGCENDSLVGRLPWKSIHPDDLERTRAALRTAADGGSSSVSYRVKVKSGVWIWFETLVRPVRLTDEETVDQVQCSTRDITARKKLEEQLEHQALHDPLTGLPNRSLFMDRLAQAPLRARRNGTMYGIVYLDLDHFKQVNDTLGHAAGDELLVQVAERLTREMRESDTLARLSGDEFAIVIEGLDNRTMIQLLARRLLDLFDEPFAVGATSLSIRPSIGVAIDEEGVTNSEALLRSADLAMYAVKRDPDQDWVVRVGTGNGSTVALQTALRRAIEEDTLSLHYQPLVSLADGRPVALEALLRWDHPEMGEVAPLEVLAIAQQGEFGEALTRWILRTALAESRAWLDDGFRDLRLCLNLSDDELMRPGLSDMIVDAVAEAGAHASALQLEFGSRVLRRHGEKLAALRAAGAIIAIDGFGIDPVSLPLLARAPIDALKIARPLIDALGEADGDGAAEAILGLGRRLGLHVTAEGIETEAQAARLREMGCDTIQGFYVGEPIPASEVPAYLERNSAAR